MNYREEECSDYEHARGLVIGYQTNLLMNKNKAVKAGDQDVIERISLEYEKSLQDEAKLDDPVMRKWIIKEYPKKLVNLKKVFTKRKRESAASKLD